MSPPQNAAVAAGAQGHTSREHRACPFQLWSPCWRPTSWHLDKGLLSKYHKKIGFRQMAWDSGITRRNRGHQKGRVWDSGFSGTGLGFGAMSHMHTGQNPSTTTYAGIGCCLLSSKAGSTLSSTTRAFLGAKMG